MNSYVLSGRVQLKTDRYAIYIFSIESCCFNVAFFELYGLLKHTMYTARMLLRWYGCQSHENRTDERVNVRFPELSVGIYVCSESALFDKRAKQSIDGHRYEDSLLIVV